MLKRKLLFFAMILMKNDIFTVYYFTPPLQSPTFLLLLPVYSQIVLQIHVSLKYVKKQKKINNFLKVYWFSLWISLKFIKKHFYHNCYELLKKPTECPRSILSKVKGYIMETKFFWPLVGKTKMHLRTIQFFELL